MGNTSLAISGIVLLCGCATGGNAAQIAYDSAGDSAYNNGWTNGSNGGFGWGGGWVISTVPGGAIIGDSTTNGRDGDPEADGDINSPRVAGGRAWNLSGGTATRMFSGPLSVGQTFSIDYDVDERFVSPNWVRYFDLLAPSGEIHLAIRFRDGLLDGFTFPAVVTGVVNDGRGLHFAFTQLASCVDVSITPYASGATTSDFFVPYTGEIVGLRLVSAGTNSLLPAYATSDFNNIATTPEPSSAALLAICASALLARRRRS